jgi:hypothetical protein
MRSLKYLLVALALTACSTLGAVAAWQPHHGGAQVAYYRTAPLPTTTSNVADSVTVYLNDQTGVWLNAEYGSAVRNGENYSGCARVAKVTNGAIYVDSLMAPAKDFWGSKRHCGKNAVVWNTERAGMFSFCAPNPSNMGTLKAETRVQLLICKPDQFIAYRTR